MGHTEPDVISVVIPTRNRQDRLASAIKSVTGQTWPDIEIIVVDDASSDGTPELLQELKSSDDRIQIIRNVSPRGGGGARNQGIEAATGSYVAFLDDDDLWLPSKLEEQHALMTGTPGASAASCSFVVEHSLGVRRTVRVVSPTDKQTLLRSNHLGGASMCFAAKSALAAVGGFDPALRSCQDWDLWIKLSDEGEVLVCRTPLVRYVPHQGPRISSSLRSVYQGRRTVFFRYLSRMSEGTRRHQLCELVYLRKVLLGGRSSRLRGFLQVSKLAGPLGSVRYLYRYMKVIAS